MASGNWVVMAARGTSYVEAWRGQATGWLAALESVPAEQRGDQMFVVDLDDIRFVRIVDSDDGLPDAELVRALSDGSLKRVRATDEA